MLTFGTRHQTILKLYCPKFSCFFDGIVFLTESSMFCMHFDIFVLCSCIFHVVFSLRAHFFDGFVKTCGVDWKGKKQILPHLSVFPNKLLKSAHVFECWFGGSQLIHPPKSEMHPMRSDLDYFYLQNCSIWFECSLRFESSSEEHIVCNTTCPWGGLPWLDGWSNDRVVEGSEWMALDAVWRFDSVYGWADRAFYDFFQTFYMPGVQDHHGYVLFASVK